MFEQPWPKKPPPWPGLHYGEVCIMGQNEDLDDVVQWVGNNSPRGQQNTTTVVERS